MKNPLQTWWKVRKFFKFPKIKLFYGNVDKASTGYIYVDWFDRDSNFYFRYSDVYYKWKWDDICLECPPYITLVLFKKWKISLVFHGPIKDYDTYWDAILTCLYIDNKDIRKTKQEYAWVRYIKTEDGDHEKISAWDDNILTDYAKNLTKDIIK
jgi:hypothetical protein